MKLRDGRKFPDADLHDHRKQAVLLYKKGESQREIARRLGMHRNTIGDWIRIWKKEGAKVLKPRRRGVSKGTGRSLNPEQELFISRGIVDKVPDQLKLPFALWTRKAVADFIFIESGFRMPVRTVGDHLKRWGRTPQKPVKRAYQRSEPASKRWLSEEYPAIKAKAPNKWAREKSASKTQKRKY